MTLNELPWRRTVYRWKAQIEPFRLMYGLQGYGRKMGELCPVGSCTKQLRSCIGFQYWYVPYIPVPYTGSTSSIGILYQNAVLWVINYIQVRFSVSSLYASPDDLTTFCHRMEQIQTQLGPIERKNGTNRLRLPLVSPIQIWVIIYVQTPVCQADGSPSES